jgi:RHS repeat-associated protein
VASYVYDASGRRVRKIASGTTTEYIYDLGGNVVAEKVGTTWTKGYSYLGGQLAAQYKDGTTYFVHKDHLGSTRLLTKVDKSYQPADAYDFLPFGESTSSGSTTHKFTGKERDSESGLDFFIARYYSSQYGRYFIPDWAAAPTAVPYADFGDPQSLNLYTYVGNNPVTQFDVDGHCWPACGSGLLSWAVTRMALDGGPKPFARNVGIGVAKGSGAFGFDTLKTVVAAGSPTNLGQAISVMMTPRPEALAPSNQTEAEVSAATQLTLTVATSVVPLALEANSAKTVNLGERAQQVHAVLDPIAQRMRTTAVAEVTNADGTVRTLVSSSRPTLGPAQRGALNPGEVPVSGAGHAEQTILNSAQQNGQVVNSMGVTRTPCLDCAQRLQQAGVRVERPQ